jgi:hypothetical protein
LFDKIIEMMHRYEKQIQTWKEVENKYNANPDADRWAAGYVSASIDQLQAVVADLAYTLKGANPNE